MQKLCFILITILAGALTATVAPSTVTAQTISGLSTPPHDSADAWRTRIWFPRESQGSCRVTIEIVDDSGSVVRHLANFLADHGYYNIYWDKRDDSGQRVPAGMYRYILDNCGEKQTRPIEARYSEWEKKIDFSSYDAANPGDITLTIAADSVPVSVRVYSQGGRLLKSVLTDRVFDKGEHPLHIDPAKLKLRYGNYQIRISAGDYTYIREVTFLP